MNLGDVKREIINLGFADEQEFEEFESLPYDAINRAITKINLEVVPIVASIEIEQDGTDEEFQYYDMRQLTKKNGSQTFLDFAETPVMIETSEGTSRYEKFNDFEIEHGEIMVLPGDVAGTFKVFYKKAHTPVSEESEDTTAIELPLKAHHLVPLLASYYVWLEDERAKAEDYLADYKTAVGDLQMQASRPRARIVGVGI